MPRSSATGRTRRRRRCAYEGIRERWAKVQNLALEHAGVEARVDHRSLADQGIYPGAGGAPGAGGERDRGAGGGFRRRAAAARADGGAGQAAPGGARGSAGRRAGGSGASGWRYGSGGSSRRWRRKRPGEDRAELSVGRGRSARADRAAKAAAARRIERRRRRSRGRSPNNCRSSRGLVNQARALQDRLVQSFERVQGVGARAVPGSGLCAGRNPSRQGGISGRVRAAQGGRGGARPGARSGARALCGAEGRGALPVNRSSSGRRKRKPRNKSGIEGLVVAVGSG